MDDLVLTIEYNKDASNPEQYFYAVGKMIEGLRIIDTEVSRCIEQDLDTEIVLSDVEKGSIKIFLKTAVKKTEKLALSIDEENRVKKITKKVLLKALDLIADKDEEIDKNILEFEQEVQKEINASNINQLGIYDSLSRCNYLKGVAKIEEGISVVPTGGKTIYLSDVGKLREIKKKRIFTEDKIKALCANLELQNIDTVSLKIKTANFYGDAKWEFFLENKIIKANIVDYDWLNSYRNREFALYPGDSLVVRLEELRNITNGKSNTYRVLEVKQIIPQIFDGINLFGEAK